MVCLGIEPGAAGWKAQTNPLSYGGTPNRFFFILRLVTQHPIFETRASAKEILGLIDRNLLY